LTGAIVERELMAYIDGRSATIRVSIGKPGPVSYGGDPKNHHKCPYQIDGIDRGTVRYICGLDSMQALVLCLQFVGAELRRHQRAMRLTWNGDKDLGFPRLRIQAAPKGRNVKARHGSAGTAKPKK